MHDIAENSPSLRFAAALLAGGKATRLGGRAKGLIQLPDGRTIIERLLAEVRAAGFSDIIVCANDPETYRFLGLQIIPDLHPGLGPLAGIEAAVHHFGADVGGVLLLPTDLPCLSAGDIRALLAAYERALRPPLAPDTCSTMAPHARSARPEDVPVVIATLSLPGREPIPQPLPAIVHPARLAGPLHDAIASGNLRVRHLWDHLGATTVTFSDPSPFTNINTPEDLARLLEQPDPGPDHL
jgi:molybdopterin-guanine dinucleotide biosynthesis protein A